MSLSDALVLIDDKPIMARRGVVYATETVDEEEVRKPVYIVEMLEEDSPEAYITVYEAAKDSNPPVKAFRPVVQKMQYKATTPLGELASKLFKPKEVSRVVERPPIFVTRIQEGKDTFTHKVGLGFYEREPDRIVNSAKDINVTRGSRTGVFITLASIDWIKHYIAPDEAMKAYRASKVLWYER